MLQMIRSKLAAAHAAREDRKQSDRAKGIVMRAAFPKTRPMP